MKLLEFTIIGAKLAERCEQVPARRGSRHRLPADGADLTISWSRAPMSSSRRTSDATGSCWCRKASPIRRTATFRLVQRHRSLPLWLAGTAATGLSDAYRAFCVASDGYRDLFIAQGREGGKDRRHRHPELRQLRALSRQRICAPALVLVCTSPLREIFRREDRPGVHPQGRRHCQRPSDDLQVPPQRGHGAGREGSASACSRAPWPSGTAARRR